MLKETGEDNCSGKIFLLSFPPQRTLTSSGYFQPSMRRFLDQLCLLSEDNQRCHSLLRSSAVLARLSLVGVHGPGFSLEAGALLLLHLPLLRTFHFKLFLLSCPVALIANLAKNTKLKPKSRANLRRHRQCKNVFPLVGGSAVIAVRNWLALLKKNRTSTASRD